MKKEELNKRVREYQSLFIKSPDIPAARFGKSMYIQKKHHERIAHIVHIIGKSEITLYEYVNNVLTEHFNKYDEEITQSFNSQKIY